MQLTKFLKKQVDKFNKDNKCGNCWEFHAPLTEDALEKQQLINPCCIQVMLTRDVGNTFGITKEYNNQLGVLSNEWEFENFRLYFLKKDEELRRNNYDEVLNHDINDSNAIFLDDLKCCVNDLELDFCTIIGQDWQVTSWNAQQILHYTSNNYVGYRVNVSIRKRKLRK